jgi:hypothetical protein
MGHCDEFQLRFTWNILWEKGCPCAAIMEKSLSMCSLCRYPSMCLVWRFTIVLLCKWLTVTTVTTLKPSYVPTTSERWERAVIQLIPVTLSCDYRCHDIRVRDLSSARPQRNVHDLPQAQTERYGLTQTDSTLHEVSYYTKARTVIQPMTATNAIKSCITSS